MPKLWFPFIGQKVGSYQIQSLFDEGGMADVYVGKHMFLRTTVAIKILKENLAHNNELRQEFKEEALRIAHLDHPNIVRILDSGFVKNRPYLVMPLAKNSLKNTQGMILPIETILIYLKQIADALQYAHDREIVHRDIKPANFLLGSHDEVLLSDFGIATITYSVRIDAQKSAGTPQYMPPEQWQNHAVRASDQYALGICLYHWLCGNFPFQGSMEYLMWAHINQEVPPLKIKEVAPEIENVVLKSLSKEPSQRFESVTAFAHAFACACSQAQLRRYQATNVAPSTKEAEIAVKEISDSLTPHRQSIQVEEKIEASEDRQDKRQLFTVLDVGEAWVKAMIVEVKKGQARVLGVGQHPQWYRHMADSIVTDIPGVIANCNEAVLKAESAAGGIIARSAIIGITGELVKGSSISISKQRQKTSKPIAEEEVEALIIEALQRLLNSARENITQLTGYKHIEVRLTNAMITRIIIDGQLVTNPIGFLGSHITLTLFSAFAPLMQLGALETVAQGLDISLTTIVAAPYALAHSLSTNAGSNSGAIFIDIGAGTTNIALVRQGTIEDTRTFALAGRAFTRRIATNKGISLREAEALKISYSNGAIKGSSYDEIQAILAPECQTWMDSVELLIKELANGELLPPAIYIVGGGSGLVDIYVRLESFPWAEKLPFLHQPIIRTVQPDMVPNIIDQEGLLINTQDIMPMALAYLATELQIENSELERITDRVINKMRI